MAGLVMCLISKRVGLRYISCVCRHYSFSSCISISASELVSLTKTIHSLDWKMTFSKYLLSCFILAMQNASSNGTVTSKKSTLLITTLEIDGLYFSQRLKLEDAYAEMKSQFDKPDWKDHSLKGSCFLAWSLFMEHWLHFGGTSNTKSNVQVDLPNTKQLWRDRYGQDSKVLEFLSSFVSSNREYSGEEADLLVGSSSFGNSDILKDFSLLNLDAFE